MRSGYLPVNTQYLDGFGYNGYFWTKVAHSSYASMSSMSSWDHNTFYPSISVVRIDAFPVRL